MEKYYDYIIVPFETARAGRGAWTLRMTGNPYGSRARIGIATPQANPTVEPEMWRLMPDGVSMLVTRSVSRGNPRQRLLDYFHGLEETLERYGGLRLDAFGFACTASSYLLEAGVEERSCGELAERFAYPIVTAAAAVEQALRALGAKRLAIASPYPEWIHEACLAHWRRRGFEVTSACTASPDMEDTYGIYSLDPRRAADLFAERLVDNQADAVLITGTGMPTLSAIARLQAGLGQPVLSSNLCLAWACLRAAGASDEPFPALG